MILYQLYRPAKYDIVPGCWVDGAEVIVQLSVSVDVVSAVEGSTVSNIKQTETGFVSGYANDVNEKVNISAFYHNRKMNQSKDLDRL